ncbi:MAG TPA: SdpI family protein [Chthoniobacteraceae bacterium]|nr:SdpI family protein [Chthoniobacteraceae bacterium]
MQPNPKPSKLNWLEYALLAAPFAFIALEWGRFPDRIPTHWNIHGQVDGRMSKPFGLLLLPVVNLLTYLLLRFMRRIDPKIARTSGEDQVRAMAVLRIVRIAIVALFFGTFCFQAAIALGHHVSMNFFVFNACLLLFIVIGNYFSVLRPNYFVGIRTPWTLENPETWRATHRAGGRIMVFGALLLLAVEFFIPGEIFAWLFVAYIFGFALWALVYSWNYSRTHAPAR